MRFRSVAFGIVLLGALTASSVQAQNNTPPAGFTALFNGKDLTGWHGMGTFDPRKLEAMPEVERAKKLAADLADMQSHWKVEDGELVNDGKGAYLTTDKDYGDVEFYVDFKMYPKGDSGVYLRSTPQIQIWDYTEEAKFKLGADKGSGGLWNNSAGSPGKDPLVLADKPFGEWNTFHIVQVGSRTTVELNGKLVVDHAILENYFAPKQWAKVVDKKDDKAATNAEGRDTYLSCRQPLYPLGKIQLQTHGSEIRWRNVYVREIGVAEANERLAKAANSGFESVFNGKDLDGWAGATNNYEVVDGAIRCKPKSGGTLHTKAEYSDFVARVEIKIPPGGNNGLAIRYPGSGDTAYVGMCELQVLDSESPKYAKLDPRQYHGSAYGMAAAHRGYLRPAGEWNFQEVTVKGSTIKVELNGYVILDTDLSKITEYMAKSPHPGKDRTSGSFGFAGHGDPVEFRNVQIKKLD